MAKSKQQERNKEIRNAKVHHNYFVTETYEAGIVLRGTEVKSVRLGKAQIAESFARIDKGEVFLYNAHISEYAFGNLNNHNPTRPRKLLLNRREIHKILGSIESGGKTLIPTRMYLKHGLVKVELGLCTGKKLHDKRETLKRKIDLREAERAMKRTQVYPAAGR